MNDSLVNYLLQKHGPMLGGQELVRLLGFRTTSAFHKARTDGRLDLKVFLIFGRRGYFCLTTDFAQWLESASNRAQEVPGKKTNTGNTQGDSEMT